MVTEETFCVHISRGECLRLSSNEKRYRNRSLCNQLYTPPSYPGYTSTISGLNNSSCGLLARRNSPRWPSNEHDRCQVKSPQRSHSTVHRASYLSAQPIFSIVTDIEQLSHSDDFKVIHGDRSDCSSPRKDLSFKDSSGYGSGSSYSDLENEQPTYASCEHKTMTNDSASEAMYSKRKHSKSKLEKNLRRRSVPANMRDAFSDEIMHVLEIGGVLQYETNADTGVATPIMNGHSINRPESVVELARKFSAAAAAQNNRLFYMNQRCQKSNSGPSTPIHRRLTSHHENDETNERPGGIASLSDRMSKTNVFKQFDQLQHANQPKPMRSLRPSSIKDALLRWVQIKLQDYPVKITNFSSSWADGMAFCALIHRFVPDAFDFDKLNRDNRKENFELAFRVAEANGICPLLEVDDMLMMGDRPDWKCVFTYVQAFYKEFKDRS